MQIPFLAHHRHSDGFTHTLALAPCQACIARACWCRSSTLGHRTIPRLQDPRLFSCLPAPLPKPTLTLTCRLPAYHSLPASAAQQPLRHYFYNHPQIVASHRCLPSRSAPSRRKALPQNSRPPQPHIPSFVTYGHHEPQIIAPLSLGTSPLSRRRRPLPFLERIIS